MAPVREGSLKNCPEPPGESPCTFPTRSCWPQPRGPSGLISLRRPRQESFVPFWRGSNSFRVPRRLFPTARALLNFLGPTVPGNSVTEAFIQATCYKLELSQELNMFRWFRMLNPTNR
eukprot:9087963-Pyramimonas_sp.AAC.1